MGRISPIESNKETTNKNENVPVPIVAETIEGGENIEVNKTTSDNTAVEEADADRVKMFQLNSSNVANETNYSVTRSPIKKTGLVADDINNRIGNNNNPRCARCNKQKQYYL